MGSARGMGRASAMSKWMGPGDQEAARVAAAVLVLIDGPEALIPEALAGLAPRSSLEQIAVGMRVGERERRARALAANLGRLAVDLEEWSLR